MSTMSQRPASRGGFGAGAPLHRFGVLKLTRFSTSISNQAPACPLLWALVACAAFKQGSPSSLQRSLVEPSLQRGLGPANRVCLLAACCTRLTLCVRRGRPTWHHHWRAARHWAEAAVHSGRRASVWLGSHSLVFIGSWPDLSVVLPVAAAVVGLHTELNVAARPVTQQGMRGMHTQPLGPGRQIADKSYYQAELRNKVGAGLWSPGPA